jgi:molybdate transport system substrate-binding protein
MMVRTIEIYIFIAVFTCTVVGCTNREQERARTEGQPDRATELTIFAAASLSHAITEISKSFESRRDVRVYTNFAGSQTLQLQIERGAPADLFIPASPKQMDALQEKGAIHESSRRDVLRNSLVLIAPIGSSHQIEKPEELTGSHIRRIAIGEPSSVPAGIYGAEALKRIGIWSRVQPKLIPGADVRSVLAYTEAGEVDFGIVYKTDASVSEKVRIAYEFPTSSHSPIVYPAAVIRDTKHEDLARSFLQYLKTSEVERVFEKYGFSFVK